MARSPYSATLRNRTNRLYKAHLAPGIFLCYRRCQGPGTWSVEAGWLKRFAVADDFESANNQSVMSFYQAQQHALKMVRGTDGGSDRPVTVGEALDGYKSDLEARGGKVWNAESVRNHLSSALLDRAVMLLAEPELAAWRNGLAATGLKPTSINRYCKSFKAALALSAKRDRRITNSHAWKHGLKAVKGGNAPTRDNYYLADATINAIVRECYAADVEFGALIDVLAVTGVRESQVLKLMPRDLLDDKPEAPRLMMPCSRKGKDREPESRALPITPRLATMLRTRAAARVPTGRCLTASGACRRPSAPFWNGSAST